MSTITMNLGGIGTGLPVGGPGVDPVMGQIVLPKVRFGAVAAETRRRTEGEPC